MSAGAELEASAQRERELRKIVLAWLNKKGYTKAEEQFRLEAEIAGDEPLSQFAFRRGLENDFCVKNYILQWGMEDTKPTRYGESYAELREWILKLLDDLKNELSELLYPLLVHCYLELMSKQYTAEARDLLAHYRHEHEPEFFDEITTLANAGDASQLDTCPVASRYLHQAKTKVYLCHESDRLLTEFLHTKRLHIIVRLLNQYISVVIYGNTVHDMPPQMRLPRSLDEGHAAVKRPPIRFGMLAEEFVKRRRRAGDGDAAGGGLGSAGKDAAGVAVKKEDGVDGMHLDADSCSPPAGLRQLPQLPYETEERMVADLSRRVTLSKGALPSVCCYTVFNAKDTVHSMDISTDASTVVVGMANSRVKIWKCGSGGDPAVPSGMDAADVAGASAGARVSASGQSGLAAAPGQYGMVGHGGPVYSTAISPDNRFVLSTSEDKTARLWCASSQELTPGIQVLTAKNGGQRNLVTYRGHNYPVWHCAWSALGHYFVTCSHDRTARLWSTDHIYPLRIFAGHLSSVDTVAFHPNCNYVATGSCDRTCRLWDITMGECVRLFKGHRSPVSTTAISGCGKLLASGAENGEVLVWDIATSKCLYILNGHSGGVLSLDFSCGVGGLLASSAADGTLRLWDVPSGAAAGGAGSGGEGLTSSKPTEPVAAAAGKAQGRPEVLCLHTRGNMSLLRVRFSRTNLLLAAGPHNPPP